MKGVQSINELSRGVRLVGEIVKYLVGAKSIVALTPRLRLRLLAFGTDREEQRHPVHLHAGELRQGPERPTARILGPSRLHHYLLAAAVRRARGWVHARSADPFDRPIIQPNYLTEDGDRRVTIAAMRLARQLINSRAMQPYVVSEDYPGPEVQTDDEMLEAARKWGNSTFHVMGTCRMGPASDPTAVVDDHLRVRGMEGLRVIDASIMPAMFSANLNAATMMIAEKGADLVLGKPALEAIILPEERAA